MAGLTKLEGVPGVAAPAQLYFNPQLVSPRLKMLETKDGQLSFPAVRARSGGGPPRWAARCRPHAAAAARTLRLPPARCGCRPQCTPSPRLDSLARAPLQRR